MANYLSTDFWEEMDIDDASWFKQLYVMFNYVYLYVYIYIYTHLLCVAVWIVVEQLCDNFCDHMQHWSACDSWDVFCRNLVKTNKVPQLQVARKHPSAIDIIDMENI